MNRWATWLWLAFLFSIPVWMTNQYYLYILINAGIFIIAAMSLTNVLPHAARDMIHFAFACECSCSRPINCTISDWRY